MKSENKNNTLHSTDSKHPALNTLNTVIFYIAILFFIIGFNFSHNPAGNWQQQFMPFLNNRPLTDITFTDSLNGFAVTGDGTVGDTNYIVKTTNSGENWSIVYSIYRDLSTVKFINQNTGFVCGGYNASCALLLKTTNGGLNWFSLNPPCNLYNDDMHVLNEDTIWLVDGNGFDGGVRRTTNGGINWQFLASLSSNPRKIYMFNARIGFISTTFNTFKTTNGGFNWIQIPGEAPFRDMYFVDSLMGWKTNAEPPPTDTAISITTNGGLNWARQRIPKGGNISIFSSMYEISYIGSDTLLGTGGSIEVGFNDYRGTIYRTTNGGNNWLFQIPDTSFGIPSYVYLDFINKNTGWAYLSTTGIHTTNGGDTNFLLPVTQISSEVPEVFKLYQNYPNPFNAMTKFKFQISKEGYTKIRLFDITGREAGVPVNEMLRPGEYEIMFNADKLSSGVYFYSLIIDGKIIDTRKMALIK